MRRYLTNTIPVVWLGLCLPLVSMAADYVPATPETVLLGLSASVSDYWQQQESGSELNAEARMQRAQQLLSDAQASNDVDAYGRAEALLLPLQNGQAVMPTQAAYLLAYIKQHNHEFTAALALLDQVLTQQPHHLAALQQRAQINLVTADYAAAKRDCTLLANGSSAAVVTSCLAQIAAVTGNAQRAYEVVIQLLASATVRNADDRKELQLTAAGIAELLGMDAEAQHAYVAALTQQPTDRFVVQHLTDLYLRTGQAQAALELLRKQATASLSLEQEVMLLEALHATGDVAAAQVLQLQLTDKFSEAAARDNHALNASGTPAKEAAAFALLLRDGERALSMAQLNWVLQKEAGDLLLLAKAAVLAQDQSVLQQVRQWQQTTGLRDQRLDSVLQEANL